MKKVMMVLVATMTLAATVSLTSCSISVSSYDDDEWNVEETFSVSCTKWKVTGIRDNNGKWTDQKSDGRISFQISFQTDSYEACYGLPRAAETDSDGRVIGHERIIGGNYTQLDQLIQGYGYTSSDGFALDVQSMNGNTMEAWLSIPEIGEHCYVRLTRV